MSNSFVAEGDLIQQPLWTIVQLQKEGEKPLIEAQASTLPNELLDKSLSFAGNLSFCPIKLMS